MGLSPTYEISEAIKAIRGSLDDLTKLVDDSSSEAIEASFDAADVEDALEAKCVAANKKINELETENAYLLRRVSGLERTGVNMIERLERLRRISNEH